MFSELEDSAEVEVFDGANTFAMTFRFNLKNFGFGTVTFGKSVLSTKWYADTEYMSEETVAKIIRLAADDLAKKLVQHDHIERTK